MEKHAHTAVPRLALAALVALSLAMAGCEMMRSGEAPTTLTIVLVEYKGAEAGASAHRMAKELTDQKLPDVFVVDGSDYASVCVGRYHSWKDEKADLMLKRVRMIRDARGQFPFVGVLLMPVPEPLPPNPWPLEKAKGQFTLHIASWEAPGRMARAQAFAGQCRAAGYEAYVQHGPRLSMVTLGSYGTEIFDDPTKIDRPGMKPRIIDPRVKDLMENKFP
ncbi:MAG: hypothetical protein IMZ66_05185, partial [Planctomycetes bacterium]|nr:hypothetical protein [Planctomycetota bacterium]